MKPFENANRVLLAIFMFHFGDVNIILFKLKIMQRVLNSFENA